MKLHVILFDTEQGPGARLFDNGALVAALDEFAKLSTGGHFSNVRLFSGEEIKVQLSARLVDGPTAPPATLRSIRPAPVAVETSAPRQKRKYTKRSAHWKKMKGRRTGS